MDSMCIQWIQIQCALNSGPVWTGLKSAATWGMRVWRDWTTTRAVVIMIGLIISFDQIMLVKQSAIAH